MTEKNIFVYKTFLSLNILDFSLFFIQKLQSLPQKVTPSFPAAPSKNRDPVKPPPPHLQNLVGAGPFFQQLIACNNCTESPPRFQNIFKFCAFLLNFQVFCSFLSIFNIFLPLFALFCCFSEKSQTCPYFLEQALRRLNLQQKRAMCAILFPNSMCPRARQLTLKVLGMFSTDLLSCILIGVGFLHFLHFYIPSCSLRLRKEAAHLYNEEKYYKTG